MVFFGSGVCDYFCILLWGCDVCKVFFSCNCFVFGRVFVNDYEEIVGYFFGDEWGYF